MDFESETFVMEEIAPTLRAGGNMTGGHRPPGTDVDTADSLIPEIIRALQSGHTTRGHGMAGVNDQAVAAGHVIAFPERLSATQYASAENLSPSLGAINPMAVAFSCKDSGADSGDTAPTLLAMGHAESHANGGGQVAVAFQPRFARNGRGAPDEIASPLTAEAGRTRKGDSAQCIALAYKVRRLVPAECEKLMGFPVGHTDITFHGKPAADGNKYKALGNSMAVPCIRWILERIIDGIKP